ncbi:restriction endonuclease subunit S [Vibrio cholerae]|uniref:restriction endonuclease subunit S n=1 Tax=Vibrio cholerae TaxID=666 RepID=UPI0016724CFB|nr:restriction endonuclease subunit S [Vibrio cholerae]MBD1191795.1 restriction endonuclease subunit S [Vibrio cholerae]
MEHELGLKTKPDDWMLATLGEYLDSTGGSIQTGPFGSQLHASDYVEVGSPSVMPKNISVEGINTDDIAKVSDDDMQRLSKYHLESGDIVYSRRGDVEKCALVKEQEAGWLCGTGCLRVRLGSSDNAVSAEFLHAYLSSPMIREWISRNAVGATMPNLNTGILRDVPLLLPSVKEAKGIGKSWATLNNKIALNRQINQTLEQMAQTLFKSWFVDFDPVIDNALDAGNPIPDELQHRAEARKTVRESEGFKPLPEDVRQLFPDAFEESELGWVPKGWGISSVSEISEILNGFAFKSGDYATSGQFVLRTKNFENGEVARANDDVFLPDSFLDSHKKYLCEPYDYHLVMVGASVGKCAMIFPHQLPALRNQNMWCFRAKKNSRAHQSYVKYMLDMLVSKSIGLASGSAREFFRKGDFGNQKVCVGDELIQSQFQLICSKWTEKKAKNAEQLDSLTKLRDTLLPKLISGELRLDEVELAVEQEAVSAEQQNER